MILADYFKSERDATWDFALQSGVKHGVIRLPEDEGFNITEKSHWQTVYENFKNFGITPLVIEPMPNALHDHIKAGDEKRDECIEKVIKMFPLMRDFGIDTICFNWMAHIGWLRTASNYPERGGATVTEFKMSDFKQTGKKITADELWRNYEYFIKAVIPEAEKCGVKLALHPDDPPVPRLGDVERIMISRNNIRKAVYDICPSESLGVTMCQANFFIMGEDLEDTIREFAQKIHLVHFRNTKGEPNHFRETFHDNGDIDMAELMKIYFKYGVDVPIRVDHVPTLLGEKSTLAGYDALGRLFAIGYLKGYESQFEGDLKTLHDDGRKLIGRAVTATYVPTRPDLLDVMMSVGKSEGRSGNFNQWVIDTLVEGDVVVVDMYDKIYKGTFLGGNLTTAIKTRTKTGGGVIWGGIRDVEQMKQVPDVQVYYRGIDPTPIREFVMKDFNGITRIGKATVLPGDIVYGAGGGVLFIPSHLVQEVVEGAAKTHVKDDFGFEMITQNKFTTAQIDRATWTKEMLDMLVDWINTDPRGEKYRYLDWSEEYYMAENGDPNDTQTML